MKTKIVMVNRVVKLSESVQIELSTEPEVLRENSAADDTRIRKANVLGKRPARPLTSQPC